ncbi:MAG: succinate dehydrogenase assembly factor 2 family protein [Legionellales bacterium]|nr:MAG: succinate dehydrogenase assembly factor 2 family protein [Legionellales bacterium]
MKIDKAALQWQCRRGMLELDVLLERYLQQFDALTELEQQQFAALLAHSDQDLFDWLLGKSEATDPILAATVAKIRN